jgi:hypothetical protein
LHAVAYELNYRSVTATLYVAQAPHPYPGLPASPPATPPRDTAGIAAAAWQEGTRLYVLVVSGNAASYRSFIKTPAVA